jgi:hypothetical protein
VNTGRRAFMAGLGASAVAIGCMRLPRLKITILGLRFATDLRAHLDGKDISHWVPASQDPLFRRARVGDTLTFEVFDHDAKGHYIPDSEHQHMLKSTIYSRVVEISNGSSGPG